MEKEELTALIEDAEFVLAYVDSLSQILYLMGYYVKCNEYNQAFDRKIKIYLRQLKEKSLSEIIMEKDFKKKKHIKKVIDDIIEKCELFLMLEILTKE